MIEFHQVSLWSSNYLQELIFQDFHPLLEILQKPKERLMSFFRRDIKLFYFETKFNVIKRIWFNSPFIRKVEFVYF